MQARGSSARARKRDEEKGLAFGAKELAFAHDVRGGLGQPKFENGGALFDEATCVVEVRTCMGIVGRFIERFHIL